MGAPPLAIVSAAGPAIAVISTSDGRKLVRRIPFHVSGETSISRYSSLMAANHGRAGFSLHQR